MHPSLKSCTGDNDAPSNVREFPILELKIECVQNQLETLLRHRLPRLTSCDFDSLGLECKTISNHFPDDTAAAS